MLPQKTARKRHGEGSRGPAAFETPFYWLLDSPRHRSRGKDSSAVFYLGGGDLRKYWWRSETGRGTQPVWCVTKRSSTAGNGNSGAGVEYMPQRYPGRMGALGTPTPNSVALPTLGLSQSAKWMWRPKIFRQRSAGAGVGGQACVLLESKEEVNGWVSSARQRVFQATGQWARGEERTGPPEAQKGQL